MKPKAPCMGCDKRTISCHGNCERYLQFKSENDLYRKSVEKKKITWVPNQDRIKRRMNMK